MVPRATKYVKYLTYLWCGVPQSRPSEHDPGLRLQPGAAMPGASLTAMRFLRQPSALISSAAGRESTQSPASYIDRGRVRAVVGKLARFGVTYHHCGWGLRQSHWDGLFRTRQGACARQRAPSPGSPRWCRLGEGRESLKRLVAADTASRHRPFGRIFLVVAATEVQVAVHQHGAGNDA